MSTFCRTQKLTEIVMEVQKLPLLSSPSSLLLSLPGIFFYQIGHLVALVYVEQIYLHESIVMSISS